jgi:hypothetical protein
MEGGHLQLDHEMLPCSSHAHISLEGRSCSGNATFCELQSCYALRTSRQLAKWGGAGSGTIGVYHPITVG